VISPLSFNFHFHLKPHHETLSAILRIKGLFYIRVFQTQKSFERRQQIRDILDRYDLITQPELNLFGLREPMGV